MDRNRDTGRERRVEPVGTRVREEEPDVRQSQTAKAVTPRDSVRWGPLWAGLIVAITTFVFLELLAFGLGLLSVSAQPGSASGPGAWVSGIIGLIAFFTGGSVAGMTSATRGASSGLLNGLLVWALGTVLILALSALGLGQIFGALGNVVGQLNQINLVQAVQGNVPNNVDPAQIAQAVRTGALYAFFSLLLAAIASALGGWLGGRTDKPIGHTADTTGKG